MIFFPEKILIKLEYLSKILTFLVNNKINWDFLFKYIKLKLKNLYK